MPKLQFFVEDVDFKLNNPRKISAWIREVIEKEGSSLKSINYIFCSDEYLWGLNTLYLNHNTYTDIITFDTSDTEQIEGDIFISVDRVKENAEKFKKSFTDELHRVIIHGVLHLLGYSDKSSRKRIIMRKKEDTYLSLRV